MNARSASILYAIAGIINLLFTNYIVGIVTIAIANMWMVVSYLEDNINKQQKE